MKLDELGVGKITAQNTTKDVKPGETQRQAKKLGLMNGKPKLLHKTAAKNSDPNTLFNLGITEDYSKDMDEKWFKNNISKIAKKYNIDPDVALKVWQSEGGMKWQSQLEPQTKKVKTAGGKEASYGPFQLYTGKGGLGSAWEEKYGKKLSNANSPEDVLSQIDFALSTVPKRGWQDFKGAERVGIKQNQGVNMYNDLPKPKPDDLKNKSMYKKLDKIPTQPSVLDPVPLIKKIPDLVNPLPLSKTLKKQGQDFYNQSKKELDNISVDKDSFTYKNIVKPVAKGAKKAYDYISKGYTGFMKDIKNSPEYKAAGERNKKLYGPKESKVQELKIQKPDPKTTLGIKRKDMPQIKKEDYEEFIEYLQDNGAKFRKETVPASELKAMQSEFSDKGIIKQIEKNLDQGINTKAIIVSEDDFVLDGHHRWLVAMNTGNDLDIYRVNMPAYELYDLVQGFEKTYYKDMYDSVDETRGSIGIPFSSGLTVSIFPHRPLKIKKSTKGKLNYNEDLNTQRGRLEYYLKQPSISQGRAIHLGKLPKYHDGEDELAKLVPERNGIYALHPDAWEGTFYSLTNKDLKKITRYQPAIVKIPEGSIVADMAIANQFYRTKDPVEKEKFAKAYKDSIVPYGSDISHIKMPEIIMNKLIENKMKGGTDFYKFMGYKGKDLNPDNIRQLPKILKIYPDKAKPKLGPNVDPKDYYYEDTIDEDLRDWFKQKWINIGAKKKGGGHPECGTSGDKRGYAKCVPAAKAAKMTKKEKESAVRRKRAAQNKKGRGGKKKPGSGKKPIRVKTKADSFNTGNPVFEAWSEKYKKSIDCSNPKGFSQKAHCAGRKKNESIPTSSDAKKAPSKIQSIFKNNEIIKDLNDIIKDLDPNLKPKEIILDPEDYREKRKEYKKQGKPYMITKVKEDSTNDKVMELLLDNIGAGPFDGGCVIVAKALQMIHGGEIMALVRPDGIADHAVVQKGNTMYDFDGPGTPEEVISRFEKNEGARITDVRKLRMTDLTDAPRNSELAKQIASLMKEPVQEAKESIRESYEIEFVCVNPNFCDATEQKNQDRLFQALRAVPGIIVYKQDFDEHNSMAAIIKDEADTDAPKLIQKIAQQHKVAIDLENDVSQSMMDDIITGRLEGLTDYYDTDSLSEAKVEEGVNDPHIFKVVFLAGGPGSGKSFVARNILGGTGLKTMNSDDVYEILMKKQDLALDPDTIASPQGQEIRDKAKLLTKRRSVNWIDGRLGLLIDGTGKDVARYQKQAEFFRMLGYDVAMIFVNTSEEVAQQRNAQRARSLKPEMVSAMWNEVQQNLMKYQQIFGADRFHIIDNSGGLEDLDRQKNFDKVYNELQRFINTPPKHKKALEWIQNQKAQNNAKPTTDSGKSNGGVTSTN